MRITSGLLNTSLNIADRVPITRIHCQKNILDLLFLALSAKEAFGTRVFWRDSRVLAKALESLTFGQQRGKTMFLALTTTTSSNLKTRACAQSAQGYLRPGRHRRNWSYSPRSIQGISKVRLRSSCPVIS